MTTRTKRSTDPSKISHEVHGLRWLAAAREDMGEDAARVVTVLDSGDTWLTEEELPSTRPTTTAADDFGRALAVTHASGASHWGAPPPRHIGDGWMGQAPLSLPSDPHASPASWGEFYAKERLSPYLESPTFTAEEIRDILRLGDVLASGIYDHPQPALVEQRIAQSVRTNPPPSTSSQPSSSSAKTSAVDSPAASNSCDIRVARTHGDLWSGNIMWTPLGGVLIDPAAQGGHAEEDLAALTVFGCPFVDRIYAAYSEVSPLADGWQDRIALHRLHILMVHCFLFGRAYVPETLAIVRRFM
ncbi:fructosamine kinase family protein [Schaalia sp. ZJ405]|uniref:fructosamine kinase family protein n=1 Tax=Schaalia sp. ZJ405 TaxID=2709403 RepID=UPI0013ED728A|nr:fructosamine kinase family protein [Schaalia sp. ZJ405]QPK81394.1 fructosamine kinase family protein [Schaalia sp. ZJ405]